MTSTPTPHDIKEAQRYCIFVRANKTSVRHAETKKLIGPFLARYPHEPNLTYNPHWLQDIHHRRVAQDRFLTTARALLDADGDTPTAASDPTTEQSRLPITDQQLPETDQQLPIDTRQPPTPDEPLPPVDLPASIDSRQPPTLDEQLPTATQHLNPPQTPSRPLLAPTRLYTPLFDSVARPAKQVRFASEPRHDTPTPTVDIQTASSSPEIPPSPFLTRAEKDKAASDAAASTSTAMAAPANFSASQKEIFDALVAALAANQTIQTPATTPTPEGGSSAGEGRLRDAEIGYFQPDLNTTQDDPVTMGSDTYFTDVFLFVDRLRDVGNYRSEDAVRTRIPTLLRGSAQLWYTTSLSDLEKDGLRGYTLDKWCKFLVEQFKPPMTQSLAALTRMRFTLRDAIDMRSPVKYVAEVQRHARGAGFNEVYQQLTYAHNGLDVFFRQTVPTPNDQTKSADFIRSLEEKKHDWAQIARRSLRRDDTKARPGLDKGRALPYRQQRRNYFAGDTRAQQQTPSTDPKQSVNDARYPRPRGADTRQLQDKSDVRPSEKAAQRPLRPYAQRQITAHNVEDEDAYVDADDEQDEEVMYDEVDDEEEGHDSGVDADIHHVVGPEQRSQQKSGQFTCSMDGMRFPSGNKLHKHLAEAHEPRQG